MLSMLFSGSAWLNCNFKLKIATKRIHLMRLSLIQLWQEIE